MIHPMFSDKNVTLIGRDTAKCTANRMFMGVSAEPRDNRRIKRKRQIKDPSHDRGRRRENGGENDCNKNTILSIQI